MGDELAVDFYNRRGGPVNANTAATTGIALSNYVTDSDNTRDFTGFLYQLWDAQKIQGCKCDLGYSGPDCASRVAPKGDDPLTTVKSTMMKQSIQIGPTTLDTVNTPPNRPAYSTTAGGVTTNDEFFIIYHDPYGGVWRTDGIAASNDDAVVAARVKSALQALPNEVLEGVDVDPVATGSGFKECKRVTDGAQHIPSNGGHGTTNGCDSFSTTDVNVARAETMDFLVTFNDRPGQTGVQFLLEVVASAHTGTSTGMVGGAFPMSTGVVSSGAVAGGLIVNVVEAITVTGTSPDIGTISELAECSDRGLDNGDGECECFDGFRGLACEEQEALV